MVPRHERESGGKIFKSLNCYRFPSPPSSAHAPVTLPPSPSSLDMTGNIWIKIGDKAYNAAAMPRFTPPLKGRPTQPTTQLPADCPCPADLPPPPVILLDPSPHHHTRSPKQDPDVMQAPTNPHALSPKHAGHSPNPSPPLAPHPKRALTIPGPTHPTPLHSSRPPHTTYHPLPPLHPPSPLPHTTPRCRHAPPGSGGDVIPIGLNLLAQRAAFPPTPAALHVT